MAPLSRDLLSQTFHNQSVFPRRRSRTSLCCERARAPAPPRNKRRRRFRPRKRSALPAADPRTRSPAETGPRVLGAAERRRRLLLTKRTSKTLGGGATVFGLWPQNLFCPRRKAYSDTNATDLKNTRRGGDHFWAFLPLFGQNDPRPPPTPISEDSEKYGLNSEIFCPKKFFSKKFFAAPRAAERRLSWTTTYRAAKLLSLLCRIWRKFSGFCPIEAGRGFAMARENTSEAVFYAPRKNFFAVPPKGLF